MLAILKLARFARQSEKYFKTGCGSDGRALPWGGRGRTFKSCHSDQKSGVVRFPIFLYFLVKSLEISCFRDKHNGLVLPCFEG